MIVRWPGEVDGGEVEDDLVSLVDLGPSMLAACGLEVPQYMEGRPVLDPDSGRTQECEYVFATRDRYDEEYDMIRSVWDERFRYVQHYYPEQPYVQWIPYRNRHPAMQDLLERDAMGASRTSRRRGSQIAGRLRNCTTSERTHMRWKI